jgi:hypothetical protein
MRQAHAVTEFLSIIALLAAVILTGAAHRIGVPYE